MMENKYKAYGYSITSDPNFQNNEFGVTPQLQAIFETLHSKIFNLSDVKIIDELIDLVIKHPLTPMLKNFLSTAYSVRGNNKKALEVNEWILKEHPNYLFGIINKANDLIENKHFDEVLNLLNKGLEIKELYPNRDLFHIKEVTSYYLVVIRYLCAIGNIELAENRIKVLEDLDKGGKQTAAAQNYIYIATLKTEFEPVTTKLSKEINANFAGQKLPKQTTTSPTFNHKEIEWLYTVKCDLSEDKIDAILALPRATIIKDLETAIKDAACRYDYFNSSEIDEVQTYFPLHAILLLTELEATDSLAVILEFLSYHEDFLEFWLDDFLTDHIWYCHFILGKEQLPLLKNYLLQPFIYAFAKSQVSVALQQMAIHYPELQKDLYLVYKEVYENSAIKTVGENEENETFLGLIIEDSFGCNFQELLPAIKVLFDKQYIDESISGDYEDIINDFDDEDYEPDERKLKNIKEFYQEVINEWSSSSNENFDDYEFMEDEENIETDNEITILPIRTGDKIGRNDPCPCGSGKKYKKCCLTD